MSCIICSRKADATGSHIVPANLIKSCVGKHYKEESYKIDSKSGKVDVYFGRDNLKNTNPLIKDHHYKKDYILCQTCEKKLAELESLFYSEFLSKFRIEKYKQNFVQKTLESDFEILTPKKLSNVQVHAYLYSIILRYCKYNESSSGLKIVKEKELENIKNFVNGFFYNPGSNFKNFVSEYNLILVFDKSDSKGSFISSSNQFEDPYLFYFCEAIIKLFTKGIKDNVDDIFGETINNINQKHIKIIVGPNEYYSDLRFKMGKILAEDFVFNGINMLCNLNNKDYDTNFDEFGKLMLSKRNEGIKNSTAEALIELREKYGG